MVFAKWTNLRFVSCTFVVFHRHVVGFDVDSDSIEIASVNAEDLEVIYSYFEGTVNILYMILISFGLLSFA